MSDSSPQTQIQAPSPGSATEKSASKPLVLWLLVFGVVALVAAPVVTLKLMLWKMRQNQAAKALLVEQGAKPDFGGPFTLVNQDGATVTEAAYKGRYLLVYFGYTYCPDLCPTALQNISETLDILGPETEQVKGLFITVDPARDTPEKLKNYVASFHPSIEGLTGTPEQIAIAAKAYHVTYTKAEEVDEGEYMMDHSTLVYITGPDGAPIASMDVEDADPESIAQTIRDLIRQNAENARRAPAPGWQQNGTAKR